MAETSVLLVDDEEGIVAIVRAYLERDAYVVRSVGTAAAALAELEREEPQVVILDVGLPDGDGFEVCRRIRARSSVPIIMLTARDEESDRVAGLELGADDYLTKPFSPRELVARVKALRRRAAAAPHGSTLALGDVVVRPAAREVSVAGDPVELRARELDLLIYLVENKGIVVTRDQLLEHVWGLAYPGGTRTVDAHVAQLRSKLGRPSLIQTLRGVGYKAVEPRGRPAR